MSTKRTIINRSGKGSQRITPHAIALFKQVLQTDDDPKRWPIEDELNLELKREFKLESWHTPYRRAQWPADKFISDDALPGQLEKIVAAILAPYE
jgi:hypothetical protein